MPYVTVKMIEGRTEEQKRALVAKEVTEAVSRTVNAPVENVTVFIEEMSKTIMVWQASASAINNYNSGRATVRSTHFFSQSIHVAILDSFI
ncbi:hypothetical protein LSPH24S_05316 [Lysinibacillus sphaericus]